MSTDRKTRSETAQDTADRLIATATRAFAASGFAAVSLDALAAEAGVTRGALHHHFGNKAGLFEAVLRRAVAEVGQALDAVWDADMAAGADPWTAFRHCSHVYLDAGLAPGRRRILFQDAPSVLGMRGLDILMGEGFGVMVEDLRKLVDGGSITAVDPLALGHLLNGAIVNLAMWAVDGTPGEKRLSRAHATLASVFDGMTLRR